MRWLLVILIVACHPTPRPSTPFPAGNVHRAIKTTSAEAQLHFDRGLAHAYGFNYEEAQFEFLTALHADPACGMCMWGLAYVAGPNINDREKHWANATITAMTAVVTASDSREEEFAQAVLTREREGAAAYEAAMKAIVRAHPDDTDATILYSEAVMLSYPVGAVWWPRDRRLENIGEARKALERALAQDANHIGAIHFYIHLMEDSPDWRAALPYADKLSALAPGAGHLIHMASHLYLKAGRYADAADINKQAIAADDALTRRMLPGSTYFGFTMHPHHFLWETQLWLGDRAGAHATIEHMHDPQMEAFTAVRFGEWDAALAIQMFDGPLDTFAVHYARGLALVAKKQLDEATKELSLVSLDTAPDIWRPRMLPVAEAARSQLSGAIAFAAGDHDKALSELRRAVTIEDQMDNPMEPPVWVFPARQRLGAILLALGKPREAADVYRQDLARNPNNGWSLFGLATALDALKDPAAADTWKQFNAAWSRSDVKLTSSVF